MKRFCYKKPTFPLNGFVACLVIQNQGTLLHVYPLTLIYHSIAEFRFDMKLLLLQNKHLEGHISEYVMALPIVLDRLWPLKPEYWTNPEVQYTQTSRQKMFLSAIQNLEFYRLLATPTKFTKPYTQTAAVFPFPASSPDEMIEMFMQSSNYPVPHTASHAALYRFESDYRINWRTGNVLSKV